MRNISKPQLRSLFQDISPAVSHCQGCRKQKEAWDSLVSSSYESTSQCRGTGSIPGQRNKILHVTRKLSLRAATTEPRCSNEREKPTDDCGDAVRTLQAMAKPWSANMKPVRRAPQREESSEESPHSAAGEQPPLTTARESPPRQWRPSTARNREAKVTQPLSKQQQSEEVWENGAAKGSLQRAAYRSRGPWTGSGSRKRTLGKRLRVPAFSVDGVSCGGRAPHSLTQRTKRDLGAAEDPWRTWEDPSFSRKLTLF